ncbi:F-box/WD repeat-containing protein 5 [Sergentomyia squamirostris]
MEKEQEECSDWNLIPEPVLLKIYFQLSPREILNAGETCRRWCDISRDDYLWRKVFKRDFKVDKNIGLKPGAESWNTEFKRLTNNIPMVLTDVLTEHSHQVLHVSFSHNGKYFATCSKDGFVIVWTSTYPSKPVFSHNMKQFSWKYTQYSQFNQSDTLLLVSGVHFGSPQTSSGEIAVFSVQPDSQLRCRILNRPYDIFGTWFSDQFLISGDIHWLAHLVSTSILWLNKANQEIDSEHVPIMNQLYKFYNRNGSSIRAVMIANCPWLEEEETEEKGATTSEVFLEPSTSFDDDKCAGNPLSHTKMANPCPSTSSQHMETIDIPYQPLANLDYASPIHYSDEFRREYEDSHCESSDDCLEDDEEEMFDEDDEDLENLCPKYLIFSLGSKTYTPHQIGFKRIKHVNFPKKMDLGPSLKERIAQRIRERQANEPRIEYDWQNYEAVADRFDKVDKLIDLHGHIIGMGLSPDHRYLYVNSRPWPKGYVISNPMEPPPIAQEIDIHVIDLATLKRVGTMLRAHKAYTPNTDCFFIFLDVCENYVASGAEDMHAYLWDRFYGVCLAKYQHTEVVNSVAFNPRDNEMLVTTSDDYKIKVWRSVEKAKALGLDTEKCAVEFRTLMK